MKGWYFSNKDCRLRYGDNRLIKAGKTHEVICTPEPCVGGLHASKKPIDALNYGAGPMVWRVSVTGAIASRDDKFCGLRRTYLWGFDASKVLQRFARMCALDVIHLWDAPEVVVRYLKTGDGSLQDAADAAGDAADAAGDAADAAGDAARAARAAAWAAAWAAAGGAADAAEDAARAARAAAGAARAAAWDAAWAAAGGAADAAGDAARAKQSRRLIRLLNKEAKARGFHG